MNLQDKIHLFFVCFVNWLCNPCSFRGKRILLSFEGGCFDFSLTGIESLAYLFSASSDFISKYVFEP